jgi:phosphoglucomutase
MEIRIQSDGQLYPPKKEARRPLPPPPPKEPDPPKEICGSKVVWVGDYKTGKTTDGETGLPKSNVLSYRMESGDTVIVRPSGTEPKIKVYYSIQDKTKEMSQERLAKYRKEISAVIEG